MPRRPSSCSAPLALLLTLACAGKDEPTDTAGPFARRCESVSFNLTPTPYTLPTLSGDWAATSGFDGFNDWNMRMVDGEELSAFWSFVDLVGDDRQDLVLTFDGAVPGAGTQRWLVYEALKTGFSMTPVDYAVPTLDGDWETSGGFYLSSGENRSREVNGKERPFSWMLFDLSGDGRLDLVLTSEDLDIYVGRTFWRVYEGGEDGFATEFSEFSLPTLSGDWSDSQGYDWTSGMAWRNSSTDGSLDYSWKIDDFNADGAWDFLLLYDEAEYETIGYTEWALYLGDGHGFSLDPIPLDLPALTADEPFRFGSLSFWYREGQHERTLDGEAPDFFWTLSDITRDGVPDLLLSWDEADPLVGPSEWRVYTGGPSGYDTEPLSYPVPRLDGEWDESPGFGAQSGNFHREADGETVWYRWTTPNLTLDGANDLMLTYDALDPEVGQAVWRVYIADEDGIAASPSYEIALPTLEGVFDDTPAFAATDASFERMVGDELLQYSWRLHDMNADGVKDLILTYDQADPSIGIAAWHVYEGICH